MTLYEMTEAAKTLYEMLESDEIDEVVVHDTLEGMGAELKLEDYCKLIRQFTADVKQCKEEGDRIAKKKKAAENAIARLKGRMLDYLTAIGKDKEKAGTFSVHISRSQSAMVYDNSLIPEEYLKQQAPTVDLAGIRKTLLSGEQVKGAGLVTNVSVQIR